MRNKDIKEIKQIIRTEIEEMYEEMDIQLEEDNEAAESVDFRIDSMMEKIEKIIDNQN